ncbi:MAG TPA: glycerol-3-phosphate 1-O-acyltransferase PlsY [Clostridia bacterium]|nr:glycerol-3-phosphate 1-O-acyltransferase PlsY [Clostridia bacterium]
MEQLPSLVVAAAVVVAGYLIGGIPWGIVVARLVGGPDPRSLGSGRTGGANVMRALGFRAALVAGLLDAAKGAVSVLLAIVLGTDPIVHVLAALAAIVGHSRSPYIGLQGGRGVSPGWGALLVMQPIVALAVLPVFVLVLFVTRISSVASLTTSVVSAVGLLVAVAVIPLPVAYAVYAIAGAVAIWLFHLDNIQRLRAGQERRIEWRLPGRREQR